MPSRTARSRGVSCRAARLLRRMCAGASRFGEKVFAPPRQPRPCRLVRERHVVLAIKLDEAAIGNEAREQSALFDRG